MREPAHTFRVLNPAPIDPAVTRLITLLFDGEGEHRVDVKLLRSLDWIEDYGAHVGGSVYLDMPEMGVEGLAEVLAIEPCSALEEGEGRLVTGTFKHTSGEVYDLKLESESKPIGVTATHPFWSVDRKAWVSAIDLEIGETLKTLAGTTVVQSRSKREEPETVYNIEVEGDHCYRVGESGVLVHNNSVPSPEELKQHAKKWREDNKKTSGAKNLGGIIYIRRKDCKTIRFKAKFPDAFVISNKNTEMARSLDTVVIPGDGTDSIPPLAVHPKRDWLVTSAIQANVLTRVDCRNGAMKTVCRLEWEAECICFDPTGRFLAVAGENNVSLVEVLDEAHSRIIFDEVHQSELPDDGVVPIVFAGNGAFWTFYLDAWQLWSANTDRKMTFDKASGERLLRICRKPSGEVFAVTYDEEMGNHRDITLSKIDLSQQNVATEIHLGEWSHSLVSFDANVALLQPQSSNSKVEVWNLDTGKWLRSLNGMSLHCRPSFLSDNRRVVTHPCEEDVPWTWLVVTDVASGDSTQFDTLSPFRPLVVAARRSELIATVTNDSRHPVDRTCFWDASGSLRGEATGHIGTGVFSDNGRWFATISSSANEESSVGSHPGGTIRITDLRLD